MENKQVSPKFTLLKHPNLDLTVFFPIGFEQADLDSALQYKAQSDDIFVCTYPKCGTTWMQNIVWLITRYGKPIPDGKTLREVSSMLDFDGYDFTMSIDNKESQRIVKTHLPYSFVPQSRDAKYIYVARNPKDTVVSFYFHVKGFSKSYECPNVTLDGVFDLYIKGEVEFNSYFDHIGEWYQKRNEPNVLFLLYEDLKKDPEANILKIARFLGRDYEKIALKEDKAILKEIMELSSFKAMQSKTIWNKTYRPPDCPFIRKGEIGDWKNHLSSEQSDIMDRLMKEKGTPYGIDKLWRNHAEAGIN